MVRAKFFVTGIRRSLSGSKEIQTIELSPVISGSDENKSFYAFTPSGKIELGCVKSEAAQSFELGGEFYVDFTAASKGE